jgi:hypothetical protein
MDLFGIIIVLRIKLVPSRRIRQLSSVILLTLSHAEPRSCCLGSNVFPIGAKKIMTISLR